MWNVVLGGGAILLALSGCVQSPTRTALAQMSPQDASAAVKKSIVKPAGVSTAQFREMGDTARARTAAGLVRKVWQESCEVASVAPATSSPTGQSRWRVKCAGSTNPHDYSLTLPESPEGSAQVLQCQMTGPRNVECSFLGRPRSAGT
jgi:hypothetical protein